jgi:hypothetical protein
MGSPHPPKKTSWIDGEWVKGCTSYATLTSQPCSSLRTDAYSRIGGNSREAIIPMPSHHLWTGLYSTPSSNLPSNQ